MTTVRASLSDCRLINRSTTFNDTSDAERGSVVRFLPSFKTPVRVCYKYLSECEYTRLLLTPLSHTHVSAILVVTGLQIVEPIYNRDNRAVISSRCPRSGEEPSSNRSGAIRRRTEDLRSASELSARLLRDSTIYTLPLDNDRRARTNFEVPTTL